jgi:hypothetical protein
MFRRADPAGGAAGARVPFPGTLAMIRLLLLSFAIAVLTGCALFSPGVSRPEWRVVAVRGGDRLERREVREPVPGEPRDGATVYSFLVSAASVDYAMPGSRPAFEVERRAAEFAATRQPDRLRRSGEGGQPGDVVGIPAFEYGRAVPSPDSRLVAVACREWPESPWNVWVMQPDGGEPALLHAGREPAWLDAQTVLFVAPASADAGTRLAVWALRLDGTGLRLVAGDRLADCVQPAVSHDGRRLAFVKERGGAPESRDVWLCELADGRQTELTLNPSRDDLPRFGADDKHVYFRSTRGGDWGIWRLPVPAPAAGTPATAESAGGAAAGQ